MDNIITLYETYSTTRRVLKAEPELITQQIKKEANPGEQFENRAFLSSSENRQGEGGMRTLGYFNIGGLIKDKSSVKPEVNSSCLTLTPSLETKPLITVITVVYNASQLLEETILSVINQTYDNVEYIIIDGGSNDGTLDIIKKYEHVIDYWVSEKDKGIYDAMNKGVSISKGKWINFLNAGDVYVENGLKIVASYLKDEKYLYKFLVQTENNEKRIERANIFYLTRRMLNHQGIFYPKTVFRNKFDASFKIVGDYKHLMEYKIWKKMKYVDILVVKYLGGGVASTRKAILTNWKERITIYKWNKVGLLETIFVTCISGLGIFYNLIKRRSSE